MNRWYTRIGRDWIRCDACNWTAYYGPTDVKTPPVCPQCGRKTMDPASATPRAPGCVVSMKQYDELRNAAKALLNALQRNEHTYELERLL